MRQGLYERKKTANSMKGDSRAAVNVWLKGVTSTAHRGEERKGKFVHGGVSVAELLIQAVTIRPSSPYVPVATAETLCY